MDIVLYVRQQKNNPCLDCGGRFHHSAMEFDHLPQFQKFFDLSRCRQRKFDEVLRELKKCELVCANCHRVRTWGRYTKIRDARPPKIKYGNVRSQNAEKWIINVLRDGKPHSNRQFMFETRKTLMLSRSILERIGKKIGATKVPTSDGMGWQLIEIQDGRQ